jgi:hypothetical protein
VKRWWELLQRNKARPFGDGAVVAGWKSAKNVGFCLVFATCCNYELSETPKRRWVKLGKTVFLVARRSKTHTLPETTIK